MEIILIGNEKGGTAKTTTTLSLATCLTALGYRVLAADFDPSGNLSYTALPDIPDTVLYDVFTGKASLQDAIVHTDFCDVLPTIKEMLPDEEDDDDTFKPYMSSKSLSDLAVAWEVMPVDPKRPAKKGKFLAAVLRNYPNYKLADHYDFVFIDTPPSDNILVHNAIVAADSLLIPCEPTNNSLDGLYMFCDSVKQAERRYSTSIAYDGLVLSKYSEKKGSFRKAVSAIDETCREKEIYRYRTVMRDSADFTHSMDNSRSILEYLSSGNAATDSLNLALEFLERRGLEPKKEFPGVNKDADGHWRYAYISKKHIKSTKEDT